MKILLKLIITTAIIAALIAFMALYILYPMVFGAIIACFGVVLLFALIYYGIVDDMF